MNHADFDQLVQMIQDAFPEVKNRKFHSYPGAYMVHLWKDSRYLHLSWSEDEPEGLFFLSDRMKLEEPESFEAANLGEMVHILKRLQLFWG